VERRGPALLALGATPSPLVRPIVDEFRKQGLSVSIEDVLYEFQRGGNQMMRIRNDKAAKETYEPPA
jgi:hypothetical protein